MKVGSIVEVKSFCDYKVKVPQDSEDGYIPISRIPAGTFVSITSEEGSVIGIVRDVSHNVKEEYLPFLSQEKQDVFLPYAADFRNSYLDVIGIGNLRDDKPNQSLEFAPRVNDPVEVMEKEAVRNFHMHNGKPCFYYYKKIAATANAETVCGAINELSRNMPECEHMLKALRKYTERKT